MAVYKNQLYGLVHGEQGVALWRSDGETSEELRAARGDWGPRHLVAGPDGLWALEGVGRLWHSANGLDWTLAARLTGGTPWEVALLDGQAYVGGAGSDGRGILWGPAPGKRSRGRAARRAFRPPGNNEARLGCGRGRA